MYLSYTYDCKTFRSGELNLGHQKIRNMYFAIVTITPSTAGDFAYKSAATKLLLQTINYTEISHFLPHGAADKYAAGNFKSTFMTILIPGSITREPLKTIQETDSHRHKKD